MSAASASAPVATRGDLEALAFQALHQRLRDRLVVLYHRQLAWARRRRGSAGHIKTRSSPGPSAVP